MKESEARQKLCPFVKDGAMVNDSRCCYGSGCMMWEAVKCYHNACRAEIKFLEELDV